MNLIAIDIGNTNITFELFLKGESECTETIRGEDTEKLRKTLLLFWEKIPFVKNSKEEKRDGAIAVCSVNPEWTAVIADIAKTNPGERIYVVGKDIPYPIELSVDQPDKIGADRVLCCAAAFSVIEDAVVVADFGTAVTIDIVDQNGIFQGGVICPGFEISAKALHENTALLPKINVTRPDSPFGKNTEDAINCGLYYSAIAALQEITGRFAEKIGQWPQTVITGWGAKIIKEDCDFVDSYVPNLVTKGVALAWRKYREEKME